MKEIKIKTLRDKQREKMQKAEDFLQKKEVNEPENFLEKPKKCKSKKIKKICSFILFTIFVFLVGGTGGVYIDRIAIPNLIVKYPELNQYDFLKKVNERTTIIRETEEIKISQEESISEAIEKVQPVVTQIFMKNEDEEFEKTGSGIILTSDGYILTSLKNINYNEEAEETEEDEIDSTEEETIKVKIFEEEEYDAEIISKSLPYKLVILKISTNNLPVIPYSSSEEIRLGEKLIIIDSSIVTDIVSKIVEDYIPEGTPESSFQTRIQIVQNLDTNFAGSAVINLEGELVGISQEENLVIPFSEIENFIDSSIK